MKYVVMQAKVGDLTIELPVIFPDIMVHAEVAKHIGGMLQRVHNFSNVHPVSAGDVGFGIDGDAVMCGGKSVSLKMGSRDEDAGLILSVDYGGGYK